MAIVHPQQLGAFIKEHRDRLRPEDVGLPPGTRRRATGLRREEVAQLCGVSPTWITLIEQGRTTSVSTSTLKKISQALLLSKAEHEYLFNLAGLGDPQIISDTAMPPEQLQLVVQRIDAPAYVLNKFWDVVAWNAAAETLFDVWLKSDTSSRNLLDFMFIHPAAKQLIENWEERARRVVAEFRADCGWRIEQPELVNFVSGLQAASTVFLSLWETQDVMEREGGERAFHHHQLGNCLFNQVTLRFASDMDYKLVMLMPLI